MFRNLSRVLPVLCVALLATSCGDDLSAAGRGPTPAAVGLDAAGGMHPGEEDRCPVCAMTTVDKRMISAIELGDGRTFYCCGPGCMLRSWLHPEVHLGAEDTTVRRAVVTEYYSGEHVDARLVTWVAGSDVVGPMGPMIVPLADAAMAEKFTERHGGTRTFSLDELDDDGWEAMTGKKAAPVGKR